MADQPVVHIGENSPEQVAYRLMVQVANTEQVAFKKNPESPWKSADRKWILDTYGECLEAVRGERMFARDLNR